MSFEKSYNVLLVDDETSFHRLMYQSFNGEYRFDNAVEVDQMWEFLREDEYDLVILDLKLKGNEDNVGFEIIPQIIKKFPSLPVVVATKENDPEAVVKALELGAKNFLYKGKFNVDNWNKKFKEAIGSAQTPILLKKLEELEDEKNAEEEKRFPFIGKSIELKEIKKKLLIASNNPNLIVFLKGETGVGKEMAARYLHRNSKRSNKPFVAVNLSEQPSELLPSSLFGHVKGAFTGAIDSQPGFFEQAQGGVLLLDEIGDISKDLQNKLLRVLETRTIQRIGAKNVVLIDVQIVVATNRNLEEAVAQNLFRLDLYQRIKSFVIEIPPLRVRKEDIFPLLEYYFSQYVTEVQLFELLASEVVDRLQNYLWPGNVRELKNAVDYMWLYKKMGDKDRVDFDCLPEDIRRNRPLFQLPSYGVIDIKNSELNISTSAQKSSFIPGFKNPKESHAISDLQKIDEALRQFNGSKVKVVEFLGYKGTDNLRARIVTCYKNFPHLFENLDYIKQYYASIIHH